MGTLDGKVALVTGAARGQGRAHAVKLAEEGAVVVAVDIEGAAAIPSMFYPLATADDLAQTGKELEALGPDHLTRTVDVRVQDQLTAVVAEIRERFGRLDIVAANAGIATNFRKTWELSDAEWQDGGRRALPRRRGALPGSRVGRAHRPVHREDQRPSQAVRPHGVAHVGASDADPR